MINDSQINILMLRYEVEKGMGHLYEIFNDRFPEHRDVWETLISEEKEHAAAEAPGLSNRVFPPKLRVMSAFTRCC